MNSLKRQKGFTIAEITISFILIAAIAMILMPVIFSNTQSQVLMTALNKNYTALQDIHQAIPMLQARGKIAPGAITVEKYMEAVVLTQKVIGLDSAGFRLANNKFRQYINGYTTTPSNLIDLSNMGQVQFSLNNKSYPTIILKNNVYISKYTDTGTGTDYIMVDTNGKKMPNETGKDIFFFEIVNSNVGFDSSNSVFQPISGNCTPGDNFANSKGCADKYLQSGTMD